jgi:hypothetical protein
MPMKKRQESAPPANHHPPYFQPHIRSSINLSAIDWMSSIVILQRFFQRSFIFPFLRDTPSLGDSSIFRGDEARFVPIKKHDVTM